MMRKTLIPVLLASALAACSTPGANTAARGVEAVNVPVLAKSNFAIDLAAPGGVIAPAELARLNGWFQGLDLGYGDSIYVDGAYADTARAEVANLAGNYGMMVLPAAPVTAGAVPSGMVRVVVSRTRAEVPGCPNWSQISQPNFENNTMSNFGCGVNSDLAMQVANPEDLFHGRQGPAAVDAITGAKAIQMYRSWPLTGIKEGQTERPLKTVESSTTENGGK
jgi:pilus assembly protein CpaD